MIINRVKLKNWKSFEDKELIFTGGINLVEGANYAGKTSLIQALYFGLFNETLYKELTPMDLKHEGKKDAIIEIDLTRGTDKYRIRRNISGDSRASLSSYLIKLNNTGEEIEEIEACSRKNEKLKKIDDLLPNISRDYLKNINFIQEGSIYQFMNDPKYKIEEDLNSILQLDNLSVINGYCNDLSKEFNANTKTLEQQQKKFLSYQEQKKEELKKLEKEQEELSKILHDLKEKIEQSKEKQKIISELENLENMASELKNNIKNLDDKNAEKSKDLDELQSELDDLSKLEENYDELKKKVNLLEKNKKLLIEFEKNKKLVEGQLIDIEVKTGAVQDNKSELKNFKKKTTEIKEQTKELENYKKECANLTLEIKKYNELKNQNDALQDEIDTNNKIIKDFEKGICPISNETCPIADKLINERQEQIKKLIERKQVINTDFSRLKNPEVKYQNLEKKIKEFESLRHESKNITERTNELEKKIRQAKNLLPEKERIKKQKLEVEQKIKLLNETNDKLEIKHQEFIRNQERLKDKSSLINKITIRKKEHEDIKTKQDKGQVELDDKNKEIELFKKKNGIEDSNEIIKEKKKMNSWKTELEKKKEEDIKNKVKIDEINKNMKQYLEPHDSVEELEKKIREVVHEKYKIDFFQDCIHLTLKELKERKLREIKESCNRIWSSFKKSSKMDSIGWDDNFIPYVSVEGNKRTIYQLSASERALIYFSIRTALLSKLGPYPFLVVDNLLGTFMKENQELMLSLVNDVISKTDIKQIIFTGFDIAPDFKCDNKIKI
ncbi:MAG: hypothetical protein ACTSRI_14930 [Promethearchaeota archaeon]